MAFEFRIKIKGSQDPIIWRKVKVNSSISFDDFHEVIQTLFDWEDCHLYQFSPKGWSGTPILQRQPEDDDFNNYQVAHPKTFPFGELYDAGKIKLHQYFKNEKDKIVYIYDFGDDWFHEITLNKITDEILLNPICTGGKGKAPTEDCGGIWGYYELVETINNTKHPEHKEMMEWMGLKKGYIWNVNEFDLIGINDNLMGL